MEHKKISFIYTYVFFTAKCSYFITVLQHDSNLKFQSQAWSLNLKFLLFFDRNKTLDVIRELCNDSVLASNTEFWKGRAADELMKYEEHLYEFFKRGVTDRGEKMWTFWNAVFYCGTIYTTIGKWNISAPFALIVCWQLAIFPRPESGFTISN